MTMFNATHQGRASNRAGLGFVMRATAPVESDRSRPDPAGSERASTGSVIGSGFLARNRLDPTGAGRSRPDPTITRGGLGPEQQFTRSPV